MDKKMKKQEHSGCGVISFIASIILFFCLTLLITFAKMDTSGMQDGFILEMTMPPIFFLASILAAFVSLARIFHKKTKKRKAKPI
jgi:uncharacterized membrane protein